MNKTIIFIDIEVIILNYIHKIIIFHLSRLNIISN